MLRRKPSIQKRERLIQAIRNAVKLRYQPQLPEVFADGSKAMPSRFEHLQRQNTSIGKLKMLMSAIKNVNELQSYLNLEEDIRGIDESIFNNEKWRDSQIADGQDFNEEYTAENQRLLQKRSELRMKIEALLKSGDAGAILRSLEDAEQRLANVRVNSAANKTRNCGTSRPRGAGT